MPGGLLERAVGFALSSVQGVTPEMLPRRTPCAAWDLERLLLHLRDSLDALAEGRGLGEVATTPAPAGEVADPVSAVRVSAVRLLRVSGVFGQVSIGDRSLTADLVTAAGAVEVCVHGWDIAQAAGAGERRPVPAGLAEELLRLCPLVVPEPRHPLFARPVEPPRGAGAEERLVAFLGRRPPAR